jgi:hypothetical protein
MNEPTAACDHCDDTGEILEPSRTPEEPDYFIPCANCQPDSAEHLRDLLVELAQWSRVAERNGDLHTRIASALALVSERSSRAGGRAPG